MISFLALGLSHSPKQRGAVILLTVVLLLMLVTLVTLYTGKIQSFEHRIIINTQNYKLAMASATAGLQKGLALLAANNQGLNATLTETLSNDSQFDLTLSTQLMVGNRKLVTLIATGYSADVLAKVDLTEQALIYPLLINLPIAPLMVKDGINNSGEFEIVNNPTGINGIEPLSIWSDTEINLLATEHHTCGLAEFKTQQCKNSPLSDYQQKLADIIDNSASFPSDILAYLFNVSSADWFHLAEQANYHWTDCATLDAQSYGFLWVSGNCEIDFSVQIGSESQPLILVVFDGNLTMLDNSKFYGLVVSFRTLNSEQKMYVKMLPDAIIYGALVANHSLGNTSGLKKVVYNSQVIGSLLTLNRLQRVARVPGSWRDF
jgi:hypothetical protein